MTPEDTRDRFGATMTRQIELLLYLNALSDRQADLERQTILLLEGTKMLAKVVQTLVEQRR